MKERFKVAGLTLDMGRYAGPLQEWIAKATEDNLVERIWKREHTLWKSEPHEISNRIRRQQ